MGTARIEAKWAIILAVVTFVIFLISKLLGWQTPETIGMHKSVAFGGFVLANIVCLWMGLKEKRDVDLNGAMTFGQGFWTGAIITLLGTVFMTFLIWFFACCINPGLWAANGITGNEFFMDFTKVCLLFGLVLTLILGFIAKKEAA